MQTAEGRIHSFPASTTLMFTANTKDDYDLWFAEDGEQETLVRAGHLAFQKGPIGEFGVNGITNEMLLEVLIDRTKKLNELFPCDENDEALEHMRYALSWFNQRTAKRQAQGVEGTNINHVA